MLYLTRLYAWAVAHPEVAFALAAALVALMRSIYAVVSNLVKPYPRVRATVEAVASLAPDFARFGLQAARALTGRAIPSIVLDSRDAEIDRQRQVIADQAVRIRQLAEVGAVIVPSRTAAEGIERALEETAAAAAPVRNGQRGVSTIGPLLLVASPFVALLALAIVASILHGCGPDAPTPDPAAGTVRVYVAPEWVSVDRPNIALALRQLAATGPAWVESDRDVADVELRPWVSPDCSRIGGRHVVGSRVAEVDPVCARGDAHRRAMIEHELLHALGALHVCAHGPADGADCSPTVTATRAVLMPAPLIVTPDGDEVAVEIPTEADRAELARVRAVSR